MAEIFGVLWNQPRYVVANTPAETKIHTFVRTKRVLDVDQSYFRANLSAMNLSSDDSNRPSTVCDGRYFLDLFYSTHEWATNISIGFSYRANGTHVWHTSWIRLTEAWILNYGSTTYVMRQNVMHYQHKVILILPFNSERRSDALNQWHGNQPFEDFVTPISVSVCHSKWKINRQTPLQRPCTSDNIIDIEIIYLWL